MLFNVEVAGGVRHCHNCGKKISQGNQCLTFRKGSGGYAVSCNLCKACCEKAVKEMKGGKRGTSGTVS